VDSRYQIDRLIIDREHRSEVLRILQDLEVDFISPEEEEHRLRLLHRLAELGEARILEKLGTPTQE